jgi:hypothetical protein
MWESAKSNIAGQPGSKGICHIKNTHQLNWSSFFFHFHIFVFAHYHISPTFAVLSRKTMGYGDPGQSRQYPASPG